MFDNEDFERLFAYCRSNQTQTDFLMLYLNRVKAKSASTATIQMIFRCPGLVKSANFVNSCGSSAVLLSHDCEEVLQVLIRLGAVLNQNTRNSVFDLLVALSKQITHQELQIIKFYLENGFDLTRVKSVHAFRRVRNDLVSIFAERKIPFTRWFASRRSWRAVDRIPNQLVREISKYL